MSNSVDSEPGATTDDAATAAPASRGKRPISLSEGLILGVLTVIAAIVATIATYVVGSAQNEIRANEVTIAQLQQELEERRLEVEQESERDDLIERLVPLLVGTDDLQRSIATAILFAALPERASQLLETVTKAADIEGADDAGGILELVEFTDVLGRLEEEALATDWAIVVGSRAQADDADGLANTVLNDGYFPVLVYQQGEDFVVVISDFADEGSAREALLAVRSTLLPGAEIVDLDAWCPFATMARGAPIFCAATSYDQAVLADAPAVYWPLASDESVETRDIAGGYDLSPVSIDGGSFTPVSAEGPYGIGALSFDGSAQQRLESTMEPHSVLGNRSWTTEFWMKVARTPAPKTWTVVGGWNAPSAQRWYFDVQVSGRFCVGVGQRRLCTLKSGLDDGEWHHVAAAYNAESNELTVYVDAVVLETENTRDSTPEPGDEQLIAAQVSIGAKFFAESGEWKEFWNGELSRIAIYDTVLRAEQVKAHLAAADIEVLNDESP